MRRKAVWTVVLLVIAFTVTGRAACGWIEWINAVHFNNTGGDTETWNIYESYDSLADCKKDATTQNEIQLKVRNKNVNEGKEIKIERNFVCLPSDFDPRLKK
jgi:hypothetical protein